MEGGYAGGERPHWWGRPGGGRLHRRREELLAREDAHGERRSRGARNDGGSEGDALGRRSERRGVDHERDSENEEKRVCWIGFFYHF